MVSFTKQKSKTKRPNLLIVQPWHWSSWDWTSLTVSSKRISCPCERSGWSAVRLRGIVHSWHGHTVYKCWDWNSPGSKGLTRRRKGLLWLVLCCRNLAQQQTQLFDKFMIHNIKSNRHLEVKFEVKPVQYNWDYWKNCPLVTGNENVFCCCCFFLHNSIYVEFFFFCRLESSYFWPHPTLIHTRYLSESHVLFAASFLWTLTCTSSFHNSCSLFSDPEVTPNTSSFPVITFTVLQELVLLFQFLPFDPHLCLYLLPLFLFLLSTETLEPNVASASLCPGTALQSPVTLSWHFLHQI